MSIKNFAVSIKNFQAFYLSHSRGPEQTIYLKTPLASTTREGYNFYQGWVTWIYVIKSRLTEDNFRLSLTRTTTHVDPGGKKGIRRLLRNNPWRQELIGTNPFTTTTRVTTVWQQFRPRKRGSPNRYTPLINSGRAVKTIALATPIQIDWDMVQALFDGFATDGIGQPFMDWLIDSPLGSYFTQPGDLPRNWEEMRAMEKDAYSANATLPEASWPKEDNPYPQGESEDRWR